MNESFLVGLAARLTASSPDLTDPMGKLNQELDDHRWIGFEIHDGVLPWIQGAQMQLSGIRVDPEDEIRYQTAVSSLREAVIECRELIQHLELVSKKSAVSISECIESLAERLAPLADQAGQTIVISGLSTLTPQFSMSTLWSIHRIVQQAIGNAIQHAGPATISISTQQVDDEFILEVSDNGRGFNLAELDRRRGIGLTSMHERAAAMGGQLEVHSQIGVGTLVRLEVH